MARNFHQEKNLLSLEKYYPTNFSPVLMITQEASTTMAEIHFIEYFFNTNTFCPEKVLAIQVQKNLHTINEAI